MSLNGRDAVTQNKGVAATSMVMTTAGAVVPTASDSSRSSRRMRYSRSRAHAPDRPARTAIAIASRVARSGANGDTTAAQARAERDEDRIAWRVWLVRGDVVVTQAEREVDRVDVLEVAWQPREVEADEERGHSQHEPIVEGSAAHAGR